MLFAQTPRIWLLAPSTKEDLGNEDVFVSWPRQLLKRSPHLDLTLAIGIDFGGIEGVDTVLPCCLEAFFHDVAFLSAAVGEPAA